ncbi:MAG TPA: RidA family protein, partial [Chitinophagaceae bacterium]|nr:RidA family protein [Chitinophagaceae bacterium]
MNADERFEQLNLELPPAPAPMGVYKPFLIVGNLVYVSGHGPLVAEKKFIVGKIGDTMNADDGKLAARQVGLSILSTLKANLGSLTKIKRVVKTLGMVNCTADFTKHPFIINGCSELFAQVWGDDNGIGVRS